MQVLRELDSNMRMAEAKGSVHSTAARSERGDIISERRMLAVGRRGVVLLLLLMCLSTQESLWRNGRSPGDQSSDRRLLSRNGQTEWRMATEQCDSASDGSECGVVVGVLE